MGAVLPREIGDADEPHVRLVHEGGGLEGDRAAFTREEGGGESAEFVVDEREEIPGGGVVTCLDGFEETGHFAVRMF
jgi:hypothetical protein